MLLRDLLQGAAGGMQGSNYGVHPSSGGMQGSGATPQTGANPMGLLRMMLMRSQGGGHGMPVQTGGMQPAAPVQNNVPPQEDSYTASDYVQGSPSYNNGQVSLHGSFYNGGGLNGEDINQRRGGTIRF